MNSQDLLSQAKKLHWYHKIDLGGWLRNARL